MGSPEPHSAERLRRPYSFGEFTLDLAGGFLRRGANEVALRPQPFEVLVYLVEHNGRLVTKGELTEAVWPDTAVMDNSLAQCIVEIRRALADDSQRLIRTVARRGYVFTAPITTPVVDFPRPPASTEPERELVPLTPEPATRKLQPRHVTFGVLALLIIIVTALSLVWATGSRQQPRKWALALEMNPVWQPCRLVALDGSSSARQVGPDGSCNSAAWSPDGKWMYLGVEVAGSPHLWPQRFPDGEPEQITSGATEEEGVAVSPDGGSLITSIGMRQSALWIHDDAHGDRAVTSQGYVPHPEATGMSGTIPMFARDGKSIFYLKSEAPGAPTELWRTDVASGKSEKALPGVFIVEFDVSDDATEVLYSVRPHGQTLQFWVGTLDRRSPPQLISTSGGDCPYFGLDGRIVYRSFDGTNYHLSQINGDGSGRSNVVPYPVGNVISMSPDRHWIAAPGSIPSVSMPWHSSSGITTSDGSIRRSA